MQLAMWLQIVLTFTILNLANSNKDVKATWRKNRPRSNNCKDFSSAYYRRLCRKIAKDPLLAEMDRHDPEGIISPDEVDANNKNDETSSGDTAEDGLFAGEETFSLFPSYGGGLSFFENPISSFFPRQRGNIFYEDTSSFAPIPSQENRPSYAHRRPPKKHTCVSCPSLDKIRHPFSSENIKSTTPWTYCLDYDPLRFPMYLNFGMCSCRGCLDYNTGIFDENLTSKNITVKIPVMYRNDTELPFRKCMNKSCWEKLIDVPVGCYCAVPSYRHAPDQSALYQRRIRL